MIRQTGATSTITLVALVLFLAACGDHQAAEAQRKSDQGSTSNSTNFYVGFAKEKKEECLRKRYPPPAGMSAEKFCEAYGNVQAICKRDGKTGGFCE
jgi:hypothetical protein